MSCNLAVDPQLHIVTIFYLYYSQALAVNKRLLRDRKICFELPSTFFEMDLEELENGNEPKLPEFKLGINVISSLASNSHSSLFDWYVNRQADKFWNNSRQE